MNDIPSCTVGENNSTFRQTLLNSSNKLSNVNIVLKVPSFHLVVYKFMLFYFVVSRKLCDASKININNHSLSPKTFCLFLEWGLSVVFTMLYKASAWTDFICGYIWIFFLVFITQNLTLTIVINFFLKCNLLVWLQNVLVAISQKYWSIFFFFNRPWNFHTMCNFSKSSIPISLKFWWNV